MKRIEKHYLDGGPQVKRHLDGEVMTRMVGITHSGVAVLTDKKRKRIIVRDGIHGGGLDLSGLLS